MTLERTQVVTKSGRHLPVVYRTRGTWREIFYPASMIVLMGLPPLLFFLALVL